MKQTPLLRWIEATEHARVRLLAEERLRPVRVIDQRPISGQTPKSLLANLREQLCLGHAIDRLSRFGGLRPAD